MEDVLHLLPFILALFFVALGYVVGRIEEQRHYKSIHAREHRWMSVPAVTCKTVHDDRVVASSELVHGSVVISVDYYKRILMAFRCMFGGEVKSYSSLIDRGRREAMLRMKESFPDADLFLNCRLDTSTISNGREQSIGTVEVMAYGTAVRFAR